MRANVPLIGLNGFKEVGKDTVGNHLVNFYGFERRAFATKMKEAVAALWDIPIQRVDEYKQEGTLPNVEVILDIAGVKGDVQYSWSWREFLQRFGTEMGRNTFGQDFWVNLAMSEPFYQSTVFTDARFVNEMGAILTTGGKIVQITRPGYESDGHASEESPNASMIDYVLQNDGDEIVLFHAVEAMMYDLYGMEAQDE